MLKKVKMTDISRDLATDTEFATLYWYQGHLNTLMVRVVNQVTDHVDKRFLDVRRQDFDEQKIHVESVSKDVASGWEYALVIAKSLRGVRSDERVVRTAYDRANKFAWYYVSEDDVCELQANILSWTTVSSSPDAYEMDRFRAWVLQGSPP